MNVYKYMLLSVAGFFVFGLDAAAISQENLDKYLFKAVEACNVSEASRLLDSGANVNAEHRYFNNRPLHTAAVNSCVELVKLLLARGADVNHKTASGTALHGIFTYINIKPEAVRDMFSIARMLINHGANPNIGNVRPVTPLHSIIGSQANSNYVLPIMFILLAAGANKNLQNEYKTTPADAVRTALEYPVNAGREDMKLRAWLIEAYPGRNLRERTVFTLAKGYYSADPVKHESAKQEIGRMRDLATEHTVYENAWNMIYPLIGPLWDEENGKTATEALQLDQPANLGCYVGEMLSRILL